MIKKSVVFAVIIAVAFAFTFSATIATGNGVDKGPEEMVLKTEKAKKPAFFPHKAHQDRDGMTCAECHHAKDADGKQVEYADGQKIEKCSTCHDKDLANEKLNSFKKAAHKNCKACHKKMKEEGASTKCVTCHKKELQPPKE